MNLIATHNSGTGEKSRTWLFSILTPFARCQDLNILGQYQAGCTYFDIRVRWIKDCWRICHGLWQSEATLTRVLDDFTHLAFEGSSPMICITYEGAFPSEYMKMAFLDDMEYLRREYPLVRFACARVKRPGMTVLACYQREEVKVFEDFLGISWQNRTAWLPIPRFWNMLYHHKDVPDHTYRMVDFLTSKTD